MWKIALFLIGALIALPLGAYYLDVPPTSEQWTIIKEVGLTYAVLAVLCFVVSTITENYSQVDKLWSIAPVIYGWQIASFYDFEPRMILIAVLITLWGARLTYNFSRRGGYSWKFWTGDEDYRWAILRAKPEFSAKWKWVLFNLLFISLYQMGLIMLIVFPMIKAGNGSELNVGDIIVALAVIALIIIEYIADQQQYDYQTEKYRRIEAGIDLGTYQKGFIDNGLWKYMRHPNYAAEQAIWITIFFFSVTAGQSILNWSMTGAILLVLLFWGSSNFSEEITSNKYPRYKDYQAHTPRFIPFVK